MMFDKIIRQDATVDQVVKFVQQTAEAEKNSSSVTQLLQKFPFTPTIGWFKDVFWFIDKITKYKYDDPGLEQIKTPDRFLYDDKAGDCDDYSVLWLSILARVDVKSQPKIVDYEADGYWDHIYVVVPVGNQGEYLTLDNVAGKFYGTFNVEVDRKEEKVFRAKPKM